MRDWLALLVLLACWLVAGRERIWAAGIVFGLAFCVKITPVVVGPVLLLALPDFRKRLMFLSAALAVVLVAWSPYLFQQPVAVFHQVFGYKSSYGLWGLSWIFRELANAWPASAWVNRAFSRLGSSAVMLAILGLSVWMYRMKRKPSVYAQIGMVFLFFFTFTSGFAVQYLAWLTPWLVELGVVPVACFMLTTSVFLLVVYNYWNLGMPWYMAIAYPWSPHQYFQVICWLSVVVLTVIAWYRIRRADGSVNNAAVRSLRELGYLLLRISTPVRFGMAMVGIGIFLIYPAYRHMKRDTFTVRPTYAADDVLYEQADEYHNLATELDQRGRTREADAVQNEATDMLTRGKAISEELIRLHPIRGSVRTPEEYVDASLEDYNRGNFTQCVFDATESLQLRPGMPAAWNNISLCNSELGNWDAAVSAAIEALRIEPESDVVKANLDWALAEQKRASGASR